VLGSSSLIVGYTQGIGIFNCSGDFISPPSAQYPRLVPIATMPTAVSADLRPLFKASYWLFLSTSQI
jgi:hypothetical protein